GCGSKSTERIERPACVSRKCCTALCTPCRPQPVRVGIPRLPSDATAGLLFLNRSSLDSALEESGFELTVPSDRSVSNQGRQPLCNARRFGAGTGTETSKGK